MRLSSNEKKWDDSNCIFGNIRIRSTHDALFCPTTSLAIKVCVSVELRFDYIRRLFCFLLL